MSLARLASSNSFKVILSLQDVILSPAVSGTLLLALLASPKEKQSALLQHLRLSPTVNLTTVQAVLQTLLGLGVIRTLNSALSTIANNSWRLTASKGWDWPNEIAVITGGCSGIGYCTVERLLRKSIKVAIIDVQDIPQALANNPLVHFYKCDITSPDAVAKTADAIRRDLGHPSILINNAGIARPGTILEMPKDVIQKVFDVNCFSHWTTVQEFLPRMIQLNKGHIVTIASLAGFVSITKGADYCASKAAVLAFHETLGAELRQFYQSDNVLTSVVHPNFVRTPFLDSVDGIGKMSIPMLTPEQVSDRVVAQIFSRRGGEVVVPKSQEMVTAIRSWPHWFQVLIRDSVGKEAANMKG